MTPTTRQTSAAITLIAAVSESIRTAGAIPSGHLYALLLGRVSLEGYTRMIQLLKNAELIEERNNMLRWIGPEIN